VTASGHDRRPLPAGSQAAKPTGRPRRPGAAQNNQIRIPAPVAIRNLSLWGALIAGSAAGGAGDLGRVAQAARDQGFYRHAAALWTAAVSVGSADAAGRLVAHLRDASPGAAAAAGRWAVDRIRLDDPSDLARLLEELRAADADGAMQALLARDPAGQVSVDRRWEAIELLRALHAAGAAGAVDILAARIVADDSLKDLPSVASLLLALHAAGATDAIDALVARDPARHADPEEPKEVALLLEALHAAGAQGPARALATWAASNVELQSLQSLARLVKALHAVGDRVRRPRRSGVPSRAPAGVPRGRRRRGSPDRAGPRPRRARLP
jgi:hypothetical protein